MADTSQLTDFEFYGFESLDPPEIGLGPRQWTSPSSNISSIDTERKRPRNGLLKESCEWCGSPLGPRSHSGRTRLYCGQSCRQRAYQSRKRSKQLSLREGELVVSAVLVTRLNKKLRRAEPRRLQSREGPSRGFRRTDLAALPSRQGSRSPGDRPSCALGADRTQPTDTFIAIPGSAASRATRRV